jgi:hypothetical protein
MFMLVSSFIVSLRFTLSDQGDPHFEEFQNFRISNKPVDIARGIS